MCRKMTFETLDDYLSSAHTTLLLCQANADDFSISESNILDVEYKISLFISVLEDLRRKITRSPRAQTN